MPSAIESVEFNGVVYRRYPDSPRRELRVYYRSSTPAKTLHRVVYEHHFGPIPPGHHVHHRDENPLNNDPGNLECLPGKQHRSHHASKPEHRERARKWADEIRPLAAAWHGSPEGLKWHSENGKAAWAKREPVKRACEQCGKEYETLVYGDGARFCGNNCKSTWRRRSGIDDVDRVCAHCGAVFRVNRYSRVTTCSRACGGLIRRGKPRRSRLRPDGGRSA